jgi:DNA-binding GntR family transcriptional regulator
MNSNRDNSVHARFHKTILRLSEEMQYREICRKADIDVRNLYRNRKLAGDKVPAEWLSAMVTEFGVSAHWLLTGEGSMFGKPSRN